MDQFADHILVENGQVRMFERRWRQVIVDGRGIPRRLVPNGLSWRAKQMMLKDGERIQNAFVLVEVHVVEPKPF